MGTPQAIVSDRYFAYQMPVKTLHGVKHIRVQNFRDDIINNLIECFNKQFKAWYKTKPVSYTHLDVYKRQSMSFNEAKPEVVDGVVMVNKAFVTNVLDAPDYDFAGKDTVALDDVAAALNKQVFYATEALKEGANGNYRSTAQAEGLIVISDNPLDVDVVADRDVLNEMANQVYNLRATEEEMQWFHDAKLGMFCLLYTSRCV